MTGPEAMLRVLNQALLQTAGRGRFVTLVLGTVTRAEHGRIRLTLAAGHPAPLTEARGGPSGTEPYGEQRLRTALAGCRGMPASAAVQRVEQLVCDWGNGAGHDDIALLALGAPARAPLTMAGVDTAPAQRFVGARRPGREGSR